MANGNPGYISPSQQSYPPSRRRVSELRQIFETGPSDKPYRHHKPGSSHDRSHEKDFNQGFEEYDKYANYVPTTDHSDSPQKFDVSGSSHDRSYESDYGQGFRKYDEDVPNYKSTQNYGPTTEYPESPENFDEPGASESARNDGFENYPPFGILKKPRTSFEQEEKVKLYLQKLLRLCRKQIGKVIP